MSTIAFDPVPAMHAFEGSAAVRVTFLGRARISCRGERIECRLPPGALALFAMLVLRPDDVVSREEIAERTWPDAGRAEARANLRRQLYVLQRAFPADSRPWFSSDAKTVAWARSPETWTDVEAFVRLSTRVETAEAAAQLYAGDFAPELDQDWAVALRGELQRRYVDVLDRLIERSDRRDVAGLRRWVELLLRVDPWREDAVRRLITLRCTAGDRTGALAYYRSFARRLRDEFVVDPSPETWACYESIARGVGSALSA